MVFTLSDNVSHSFVIAVGFKLYFFCSSMTDLSDNSPPKDGQIVVDAPKERVVDGEDETPISTNTRRH